MPKKNILWWIKSARKADTRAARVSTTVGLAAENRMANHPRGRDKAQSDALEPITKPMATAAMPNEAC